MPKRDFLRRIDHIEKPALSVPTPAVTVADGRSWASKPRVGTSHRYAREDHSHGLPAEPEGGGGIVGGHHQIRVSVPLPALSLPPGPINLTLGSDGIAQKAMSFKTIRIEADGAVAGSIAGTSFAFGVGGGVDGPKVLSGSWPYGTAISYTITSQGVDGTYLVADILAWEEA